MMWFSAALFPRGEKLILTKPHDTQVRGPFDNEEQRDTAIRDFRSEMRSDGFKAVVVPFDVEGDDTSVEAAIYSEVDV